MNTTMIIQWTSNEVREIPTIGVAEKDLVFIVPIRIGKSFEKQKLAKEISLAELKATTKALAKKNMEPEKSGNRKEGK